MRALPLAIVWLMVQSAFGQCNASRLAGTLVIASGGREAVERFVQLAGGPGASIVFIPTAASSLKSDSGVIWNPDGSRSDLTLSSVVALSAGALALTDIEHVVIDG